MNSIFSPVNPVYFLIGCIICLEVLYVGGFFPEMKRSKADRPEEGQPIGNTLENTSPDDR